MVRVLKAECDKVVRERLHLSLEMLRVTAVRAHPEETKQLNELAL